MELGADPYPFDGLSFDEFEHRVAFGLGRDLGSTASGMAAYRQGHDCLHGVI
jgi:hypothetical protein